VQWDGFAIDTVDGLGGHTIVDELPPSVSATSPLSGAQNVDPATNISVNFSEPVNVSGTWFTIECGTSGSHTAVVSGGPTNFTLDPDTDFSTNEGCTVTIVAAQVSDQDASDPPDNMAADHVFSFTTITGCGDPATFIHDIQGSGLTSPLVNTPVEIEGVVVGDYQANTSFNGFHVQEEDVDVDADPSTSEGIFVFEGGSDVAVAPGDVVRISGQVVEFSNLTEITNVTRVLVCDSGAGVTPAGVALPFATTTFAERYESMLVDFGSQELTVTETFTLGRFGEVVLSSGGRLFNPTSVVEPGAPAVAQQAANDRNRIVLDDGDNRQNIDPTLYPQGGLSASNTLRVGDTLAGGSYVLEQRFGVYRLQPVAAVSFDHDNPRPASPPDVDGDLHVAAFNVLNYFNGDGTGGGFPTARGAETLFEFNRQRDKIIAAINGLDADIVGLMELENDNEATEFAAIEDLIQGLNDVAGAGTWSFIPTGVIGTDAIRVGIIYKPAAVTPIGDEAILTSAVDPRFIDTLNRPSIAQTFEAAGGGGRLTVVVNHLKSKGSACTGDPDTGDGQGNCNLTRTAAAEALVDWIATDPTGSGDRDVLVIGDMNAYAREDPIDVFVRPDSGYTNLIEDFLGEDAYSFVFQGQSGYLDHALASPSLAAQVTGAAEWHINADEPVVLDYNTNFKSANHINTLYAPDQFRASDHDPLVVGIDLVDFDFGGFQPPVDGPPVVNTVKAGAGVPVKFSLGGDFGLDIFSSGPTSRQFTCESGAPSDLIEETVPAGGSSLTYDPSTDTYTYVWKTLKSWANTCRRLEATLIDGTYVSADFRFTK
jgi:predicted extracellular nuclease